MINPDALAVLARLAMPRDYLTRWHWRAVAKSSCLFKLGYSVNIWLHCRRMRVCHEYNPRLSKMPRLTAFDYLDQVMIHQALGLHVVPRGRDWHPSGQRSLFDELEA